MESGSSVSRLGSGNVHSISPGRFNTLSTWGGGWGGGRNPPPSVTLFFLIQLNQIWCGDSPS